MYLRLRADYPKVPRLDSRAWLPVLRLAQVPGCPRLRSFSSGLLFHVFFCVRCLVPGLDCVVSPLFVFLLFSLQGSSTFVTLICLCLLIPECVIVFTVVTPWFLFSVACSPHHVGAGYVGVSRFQTRDGVYLYSRLRSSDFVPVDLEQEHPEKIERGCLTCFPVVLGFLAAEALGLFEVSLFNL